MGLCFVMQSTSLKPFSTIKLLWYAIYINYFDVDEEPTEDLKFTI